MFQEVALFLHELLELASLTAVMSIEIDEVFDFQWWYWFKISLQPLIAIEFLAGFCHSVPQLQNCFFVAL